MRRLLSYTFLLSLVTACVAEDDLRTANQQIMGGEIESDLTGVVGIAIVRNGQSSICSGTLIAPNLVLTAQHCVAELASPFVVCGQAPFLTQYPPTDLFVTFDTQMTDNGQDYVAVAEVSVPTGATDACGGDIAVLRLAANVPPVVAEPIVPRIDIPVSPNEQYTAYGYGHIGNFTGSGTRRRLTNREVVCGGSQLCDAMTNVDPTEFAGTRGTCQGDSGGAPIDSEGRVLGALSRGPEGCAGAVYSAVYDWSDWLRERGNAAASAGGYTAPQWVVTGVSETIANDPDSDGITSDSDNCPDVSNPDQIDTDRDGMGDACDGDQDGDSIADDLDNCPLVYNTDQFDHDGDRFGDACDNDDDDDGIDDIWDTCPLVANPSQTGTCDGTDSPGNIPSPEVDEDLELVIEDQRSTSINARGKWCSTGFAGSESGTAILFAIVVAASRVRRRRSV